jgi:hypothetical protein
VPTRVRVSVRAMVCACVRVEGVVCSCVSHGVVVLTAIALAVEICVAGVRLNYAVDPTAKQVSA